MCKTTHIVSVSAASKRLPTMGRLSVLFPLRGLLRGPRGLGHPDLGAADMQTVFFPFSTIQQWEIKNHFPTRETLVRAWTGLGQFYSK